MKSKLLFLILFVACGLAATAQNISVADFKLRETDMTAASLEGRRIDQNGQPAALIRIETTETGFAFEAGALGIVDSQQRTGEVWVWVPRASRKITIMHQQLGVLYDYRYPIEIEAERTYWMKLVTGKVITTIQEEVRKQYLTFQVTPPNATLEVNEQLWSLDGEGIATKYVDFGTYTYRVRAADYFPDAGKVVVDNPDDTKIVTVTLKSNRAEVTLKVDADAEIWVNNEFKGIRTWTGPLGNDTYKIECKQDGHETAVVSKEITFEMNGKTINLPTPTPIYGSLNVESTPQLATLYIDGKEMGKTPKSINELLVGQHEIKITKAGYADYTETITIAKGERKQMKATMNNSREIQFTCNVPDAQLEIDGRLVGNAQGSYQLSFGQHNLRATAPGYREFTASITIAENNGNSFSITLNSAQETVQVVHQETPAAKPRSVNWKDVTVTENTQDVQGMVFLTEVTGTSTWCNAAGPTIGYTNAVKEIQKKAAEKGCCTALVTEKSYFMKTVVKARLYLCK